MAEAVRRRVTPVRATVYEVTTHKGYPFRVHMDKDEAYLNLAQRMVMVAEEERAELLFGPVDTTLIERLARYLAFLDGLETKAPETFAAGGFGVTTRRGDE